MAQILIKHLMKSKAGMVIMAGILLPLCAFGQLKGDLYPYADYNVGVSFGYTSIYGALKNSVPQPVITGNLGRYVNKAVVIYAEMQYGAIKSTEPASSWTNGLSETGMFNTLSFNCRLALLGLISSPKNNFLKTLGNLYVGTGAGVVNDHITSITNRFRPTDSKTINEDIIMNGMSVAIPVNVGINIHLKQLFSSRDAQFNINYQESYLSNDDMNGYSFSKKATTHKSTPFYSVLSVGFSFYLGHVFHLCGYQYKIDEYR